MFTSRLAHVVKTNQESTLAIWYRFALNHKTFFFFFYSTRTSIVGHVISFYSCLRTIGSLKNRLSFWTQNTVFVCYSAKKTMKQIENVLLFFFYEKKMHPVFIFVGLSFIRSLYETLDCSRNINNINNNNNEFELSKYLKWMIFSAVWWSFEHNKKSNHNFLYFELT